MNITVIETIIAGVLAITLATWGKLIDLIRPHSIWKKIGRILLEAALIAVIFVISCNIFLPSSYTTDNLSNESSGIIYNSSHVSSSMPASSLKSNSTIDSNGDKKISGSNLSGIKLNGISSSVVISGDNCDDFLLQNIHQIVLKGSNNSNMFFSGSDSVIISGSNNEVYLKNCNIESIDGSINDIYIYNCNIQDSVEGELNDIYNISSDDFERAKSDID